MSKTIRIRNLDDEVYAALSRRAAADGITVPELMRRTANRIATLQTNRQTMREWLERTRQRSSDITREEIIQALDEHRGPWPEA